jgi:CarD family transcriptional regulator
MVESKHKFKLKQKIVYPSQGVGLIKNIEEKLFKGEKIFYYTIFLEGSDMTVMVPVDKAEELGIRAIVPQADAERALEFIGEEFEPNPSDWKLRYQQNLDLLKKGTVLDIAAIVRSLYHRSQVKDLPIMERKLYDQALRLFEDEVSNSLKKTKEEVQRLIMRHLDTEK